MRVQGITQRPDIVAIADAADHINDIKAHRRRADIPAPGLILPADRHARARIGTATMSAAFLQRTGTPVIIVFSIRIRREAANIHIHHISTKERPSVRPGAHPPEASWYAPSDRSSRQSRSTPNNRAPT